MKGGVEDRVIKEKLATRTEDLPGELREVREELRLPQRGIYGAHHVGFGDLGCPFRVRFVAQVHREVLRKLIEPFEQRTKRLTDTPQVSFARHAGLYDESLLPEETQVMRGQQRLAGNSFSHVRGPLNPGTSKRHVAILGFTRFSTMPRKSP